MENIEQEISSHKHEYGIIDGKNDCLMCELNNVANLVNIQEQSLANGNLVIPFTSQWVAYKDYIMDLKEKYQKIYSECNSRGYLLEMKFRSLSNFMEIYSNAIQSICSRYGDNLGSKDLRIIIEQLKNLCSYHKVKFLKDSIIELSKSSKNEHVNVSDKSGEYKIDSSYENSFKMASLKQEKEYENYSKARKIIYGEQKLEIDNVEEKNEESHGIDKGLNEENAARIALLKDLDKIDAESKVYKIKKKRKAISERIGLIALIAGYISLSLYISKFGENDLKQKEEDFSIAYEINFDDSILKQKEESVYDVLDSNKYLDGEQKKIVKEFIETIETDFDLTIFKKNLKNLKIYCLTAEEWNKQFPGIFANSIFVSTDKKIYCKENYNGLNYPLFKTINVYYNNESGIMRSFHDLDNNKGSTIDEYITSYYNWKYFDSIPDYNIYADKICNLFDSETIKFFYEKGTVNDFIYYLNCYYPEYDGEKLVELFDKSAPVNSLYDKEYYNNIAELEKLLIDYDFAALRRRLFDVSSNFSDSSLEDKRMAVEMLIKTLYIGYYDYSEKGKEYFETQLKLNLENQYMSIANFRIFISSEEYKNLVNRVNIEIKEAGNAACFYTKKYEDVIKTLKEQGIIENYTPYSLSFKSAYDDNSNTKNGVKTLKRIVNC